MKKIIAVGLMTIFFAFSAMAQADAKNEKQDLTDKIFALYQKGDLEEAIKLGEKLVKMEKDSKDSASYVNALVNLARLKRAYFVALQNDLRAGGKSGSERRSIGEKANRSANEAEELFREALALNVKDGREKTAQTADIKKDLAWIVSNHSYTGERTVERSRSRIDEAEALLLDALALSEQTRKSDADETLFIALDAGDFYYKYVNFEKALPFYERFIQTYGQKHGANHPDLVGALRPFAAIMFATFQESEAAATVKKIEAITKKNEPALTGEIDFYLRSKDAVAAALPVMKEQNERAQTYRNIRRTTQLSGGYSLQSLGIIAVPVVVEIDETGKVVKAVAKTDDAKLKAEAEAAVAKWIVRPFSYNGTSRKMRGTLFFRKAK